MIEELFRIVLGLQKDVERLLVIEKGVSSTGGSIVTVTTTYVALITDSLILCDATTAAFTITLPTVATATGVVLNIKRINAGSNNVTVDGAGAETIDGDLTKVLSAQWTNLQIRCNGASWSVL